MKLGDFDESFAEGWHRLESDLDDWLNGASHWDHSGLRHRRLERVLGSIMLPVGIALVANAAVGSRDGGTASLVEVGVLVTGGGSW